MDSTDPQQGQLDKRIVARHFNRAVATYDHSAVLQRTVLDDLLERLDHFKLDPQRIVDLGGGNGLGARLLNQRYKTARVLVYDLARGMLVEARRKAPRWRSRQQFLCGDAEAIACADNRAELVVSNLTLQWCNSLAQVFKEVRRILKPNGLFLFSTFGPDTLKELRASWSTVDRSIHVHDFIDMHEIGDELIRSGFSGPVMDVEHYTLTYTAAIDCLKDLKAQGAVNASQQRTKVLTGRNTLGRLLHAYETHRINGQIPATYEVVYGHAWVPEASSRPQDGSTVARFPVSDLIGSRAPKSEP